MVTIEESVRTLLVNNATVSALVGTKVYPQSAPQNTAYPYVTYNRISGIHERHMSAESGVEHPRIQLDVFASTYSSLAAIKDAIRLCLDMYSGTVTVGAETKTIQRILLEDDFSDFLAPLNASETGIRHGILDFTVWGEESTT